MTALQGHRSGLALVALAAICWSSAGLFTRLIEADLMTMLFWRGIFSGSAVLAYFFLMERGNAISQIRSLGWPALAVAVLSAMSMVCGIGSLRYASVADVMIIYATVPFVTAGLAWLVMGERASTATLIASLVAFCGVMVSMYGADWGGSLYGRGLAVFMTLGMAGFSVLLRLHRDVPMLPAMGASAWLCSLFCFWFADPLSISAQDFVLVAMFGIVQNAAGLIAYTIGSRRIPASEATLIAALEVPLTPFWVWLFLTETPSFYTLIGGIVVLTALVWHIQGEFRRTAAATTV